MKRSNTSQIAREDSEACKKENEEKEGRRGSWDLASLSIPQKRIWIRKGAERFVLKLSLLQPAGSGTCEAELHRG